MCLSLKLGCICLLFTALTMFIAICFPFFGGLLGFFGGFAFAPTTYFVSKNHISNFFVYKSLH